MIAVSRVLTSGENVDPPGQDVRAGEKILSSGHISRPHDEAMFAALLKKSVSVMKKPKAAIIPCRE